MLVHSPVGLGNVEQIYDAALEGRLFEAVLDVLAQSLDGAAILLFGEDSVRTSGNFLLHRGLNSDAVRSYVAGLAVQNPWFQRQWQQLVGYVYQDDELLDRETFVETPFYKEWLSLQGPLDCATGLVFHRRGTRQLVIEVRYPAHHADFLRGEARRRLAELATHIVRAAQIMEMRYDHPLESQRVSDLLELLSFPAFILDGECRIHNMNARADAVARRMDALFVSADGYLHATEPERDLELKGILERLATSQQHVSEALTLRKTNGQSGRYFGTLTTLGAAANRGIKGFENIGHHVALIMQDSAQPLRLSHDTLWRNFGLTNSESELAVSLLDGTTIGEYALEREVSKQTLRNQLVSIMRKTETSRQPELVGLLTRLAMSAAH